MIRVKLTSNFAYSPFLRQTPGSSGRWGDYQFFVNDNTADCDWWVVYEGLDKPETVKCPKERTIFIAEEPPTIKKYNSEFISQFHTIISCQRGLKHPNVINTQKAHPWMVGCRFVLGAKATLDNGCSKGYDELKAMRTPIPKSKLISVVSSSKKSTPGHARRLQFSENLKKHFGDEIDFYGRGINDFADKWDVIAPYKYHIAIENSSYPDYYTEKLVDTFLAGAYPIYYGCPNIEDYFPHDSLQAIDINDTDGAIRLIKKCIEENRYQKNLDLIKRSRDLILDRYNIFPFLCDEIFANRGVVSNSREQTTLIPEVRVRTNLLQRAFRAISRGIGC